ncbi:MAG: sigma-54-dependent transcriptional regulator [Planctomycetota bacterium]
MTGRVLLADDDAMFLDVFARELRRLGFEVRAEAGGVPACQAAPAFAPDAVILDWNMPDLDGLSTLRRLRAEGVQAPVILLTGEGTDAVAREAFSLGAQDYLTKPASLSEVEVVLRRAIFRGRMETELVRLHKQNQLSLLVGSSAAMNQVRAQVAAASRSDITVVFEGPTGSGKELAARCLHAQGARAMGPFVTVSCGLLSSDMLMSELFGHVRGAFSGASEDRRGLIEEASGGTLLLDDIAVASPQAQVSLLRVVEEGVVRPVGSSESRRVDVRFLATSQVDLASLCAQGRFREDLRHRLGSLVIKLPSLSQHSADIPELVSHWAGQKRGRVPALTREALEALMAHDWPGNVRELRNAVERLWILCETAEITAEDVETCLQLAQVRGEARGTLRDLELREIERTLTEVGGDRKLAAERLGISLRTLYYRLKQIKGG